VHERGARLTGAQALAEVGDLQQQRPRRPVGGGHGGGQDGDRNLLAGAGLQVQLHGLGTLRARRDALAQRGEGRPVAGGHERVDVRGQVVPRPARQVQQRGVGLEHGARRVHERDAVRGALPRRAQQLVGLLARGPLAGQVAEDRHLRLEHQRVERLEDVVHRTRLVAARDVVHVGGQRREEDDRSVSRALAPADQRGRLEAVHSRHLDVEEDRRELVGQHRAQRLLPRAGTGDLRAERREDRLQCEEVPGVVVDDQDGGGQRATIGAATPA